VQEHVLFDHLQMALSRNKKPELVQVLVEKIEDEETDLKRFVEVRLIKLYSDVSICTRLFSSYLIYLIPMRWEQASSAEATWPGPLRNPIQTFAVRIFLKF